MMPLAQLDREYVEKEVYPPERLERLEERFQEFRKQHQEYRAAVDERERIRAELDRIKDGFSSERSRLWGVIGVLFATSVSLAIALGVCLTS